MVRSAPLVAFLVVAGPLFVIGVVGIVVGLRARRRVALITATPTTPIGIATDGYREFEGRAEPAGGAILAPLTDSPCVWFRAKIAKWERIRSKNSHWRTIREWSSSAPFLVRDVTGICLVEPRDAEVTPTDRSVWYGATDEPTDRTPLRVGPHEYVPGYVRPGGPDSQYRYVEERIYAGDPLLVLGEFSNGRFVPGTAFAVREDADQAPAESLGTATKGRDAADEERRRQAREMTRSTIARASGAQPFVITATPQAEHLARTAHDAAITVRLSMIPLAIAAVLFWLRFGSM
jgi:hypothetical protein